MKLNNYFFFAVLLVEKLLSSKRTGLVWMLPVILQYRHFIPNKELFVSQESVQSPQIQALFTTLKFRVIVHSPSDSVCCSWRFLLLKQNKLVWF